MEKEYKDVTKRAAREGYEKLKEEGGTAVDAVEAAVRVFEDSELINAGRGSALNCCDKVECEAMIMNGEDVKTGAVMNVSRFLHPVSLARKVMDESPHCAISGDDGALEFAKEKGYPDCKPEELIGSEYPEQKVKIKNSDFDEYGHFIHTGEPVKERRSEKKLKDDYDTASAVAIDAQGNLACATSTGGIAGKLKGRVGDAPLVGCGGYANEFGAATTTGHGERMIRMTVAREAVYNMERGLGAKESAQKALKRMIDRVKGHGGIIAIDREGNFGKVCNTVLMVWASIKDDKLEFGLKAEGIEESLPSSDTTE
ncbi:isoaspartyl peptidase/L-asparaginase-like [Dendronephthya gigantea]|uniref:isoaspartyl peptidase/L-asparaginase-like n=1 Tax=Dendronephthya gigantea TaxID=151771 RepID=UPI00106C59D0|nr:isoaspartyl peptidase/L-asparaginase-like [Dendronephthya gigantea]